DSKYFTTAGVNSYPLQALADGVDGGNGVFTYAAGGGFPGGTYQAANYWVDVTFSTTAQDTAPPAVAAQTPAPGATAAPTGSTVAAPVTWSFGTSTPAGGLSVWTDATVPAIPAAQNDSGSIEVGMKFRSDTAGYITGLRFYKGAGNAGTHVGHLWSSTGTL